MCEANIKIVENDLIVPPFYYVATVLVLRGLCDNVKCHTTTKPCGLRIGDYEDCRLNFVNLSCNCKIQE